MKQGYTSVLAVALIAVFTGFAIAAHAPDGAVIRNTGSTNFPGYTIKLWSDGRARFVQSSRGGSAQGPWRSARVSPDLARAFFTNVKAAKRSGRIVSQSCMKSASFGTSTVVLYHGWTTPDLECPGDGFVVSLASQAHQIASALHAAPGSSRRPLLPNEPRRVPETFPGQASPTPESPHPTP